jgi:hypothetical protein
MPVMRKALLYFLLLLVPLAVSAQSSQPGDKADIVLTRQGGGPRWALAIHGGAGTIPKTLPEAEKQQYLRSLGEALKAGQEVLRQATREPTSWTPPSWMGETWPADRWRR